MEDLGGEKGPEMGAVGVEVKERKLFTQRSQDIGEVARALQARPGGHARL